jgi:3-oxoacyl-[acyl-carrier protein] reductase
MFELAGRTALVTGASGGIGGAIATVLHSAGATIVLTGRRQEALEALNKRLGENCRSLVADLADPQQLSRVVGQAGPVDILVNNAGISHREPTDATGDAAWDQVIEVDLSSVFRLSRALLPAMASRKWGRVISIGSILGQTGATGMGPYSAAKAGLVGLTKALALEFSPSGVTVNCVAPGYIRTPMMDMNPPETLRTLLARIPVGFFGSPEDVGGAVLYLASSEARFVTGSTLHINGGMEMS